MHCSQYRTRDVDHSAPHRHPYNVCNGLLFVEIPFDASAPAARIAQELRRGIKKARDPAFVEKALMLADIASEKAMEEDLVFDILEESTMSLNAQLRYSSILCLSAFC
jgi:hypothetical protein